MMAPFRRKFIQAPEIFSSFSSKEVEEGETVELKCFISCAPQTVSVWEKDNIPLVSSPGLSLSEKTGVRTLMIQSAKLGDAGVYRLTISNTSGSGSCSAIVTVKSKLNSPVPCVRINIKHVSPFQKRTSGELNIMPPVSFLFREVLTAALEEVALLDLQIPTAPAPIIVILLSEHIYDMFVYYLLECPAIVSSQFILF